MLNLTAYCYSGCAMFNCIDYVKEEEMAGRQFNSLEQLEPSA